MLDLTVEDLIWWILYWCRPELSVISVSSSFPRSSPVAATFFSLPSHHSPLCHSHFELQLHTRSLSTRGLPARPAVTKGQQWLCTWQWLSGQPACHTLHHGAAKKPNCAVCREALQKEIDIYRLAQCPLLTFERSSLGLSNSFYLTFSLLLLCKPDDTRVRS